MNLIHYALERIDYVITGADISNGSVFFTFPVPSAFTTATYYSLHAVHGAVNCNQLPALLFVPERVKWFFGSPDIIKVPLSTYNAFPTFQLTGSDHDFFNPIRFKTIQGISYLCQVEVNINGTGALAGNTLLFAFTLTLSVQDVGKEKGKVKADSGGADFGMPEFSKGWLPNHG